MRLIVWAFLTIIATSAFSQEKGKIRGGINVMPYNNEHGLFPNLDLQIGYNLLNNMNVGFKFGIGDNSDETRYFSCLGTGSYYFNSGKSSFAPFVGGGMGIYDVRNTWLDDRSTKFGSFLTVGFEAKKFRMAFEYNFIPSSTLNYYYEEYKQSVNIRNSYFTGTLGFYIGGGKWKRTDRLSGFVDKKGDLSIPPNYHHVIEFSDELAALKVKNKWGFVDEKMKEVIPFKYDGAGTFSEGLARVKLKKKWGFIDKTDRLKIPFIYDEAGDFSEGQARVKLNAQWILIDTTGKEIIQNVVVENRDEGKSDVVFSNETQTQPQPQTLNTDIITLRNGDKIKAKVTEITVSEIKYKRLDNLDGPTITIPKAGVFAINYSNGTREVINPLNTTKDTQSAAIASKNSVIIGSNFIVGTGDDYTHVGFGAKLSYNAAKYFRLSGEFDYFPTKDNLSWWDYTLYGDFLIPASDKFAICPSVGVGGIGIKAKELSFDGFSVESSSVNKFALSAGVGFDCALSPHLIMNAGFRVKFIFLDNDNMQRYNFILGLGYKF